jgi:hypothetical protein
MGLHRRYSGGWEVEPAQLAGKSTFTFGVVIQDDLMAGY